MKESYDQIKVTVSEVFKTIEGLLHKSKMDKLDKTIDEDLTITYQKDEKLEEESKEETKGETKRETKGEPKEEIKEEQKEKKDFLKSPFIFDKKINITVADYPSDK